MQRRRIACSYIENPMTFSLGIASLSGTHGSPCRSPLSITTTPQDYVGM
ncbi:hypothetical protein SAMN04489740_4317 [Arthrobacter alpinus]|uniref:Uncharacterized protein n=1 Tax=Arthrobacter alpinus TaxID=656366 RepID=A0A1H5PH84_9MICC|nr:hypothetical protein SAMN04489740_4317 [Arthrobacter alpinus]